MENLVVIKEFLADVALELKQDKLEQLINMGVIFVGKPKYISLLEEKCLSLGLKLNQ